MSDRPKGSLRLKPAMRLRTQRDFARLKAEGQRMVCGSLIANWLVLPSAQGSQLGVITSRRIGGAVARSRARRLLRESFRLHQHQLRQPVAVVLIARSSIVGKRRGEVEADFLRVLRRGGLNLPPP
jgi:ribonuclease P protein component